MTHEVRDLGRVSYSDAFALQKELVAKRQRNEIPDTLLLVEHPPIYTIGKVGKDEHLLADEALLRSRGAEVFRTDRGGDITYHGPGQIVGYPIVDLTRLRRDVKWYVEQLEEIMIRTVAGYGIKAGRVPGMTGAWVESRKIGAIGVRVERWVTCHGFALNVNTDLDYFKLIVPCGIQGKDVTSVERELGRPVDLAEARERVAGRFAEVLYSKA